MEVYRTPNNQVAKYVHDDGSETAIKTTPPGEAGCGGYGDVDNKYNVFISSSVGCPVGCKFCYLTVKKCPYHKLTAESIALNVIEAIAKELTIRPELYNMYTKLSWMGMGDGFLDTQLVYEATVSIIDYLQAFSMSLGIDSVDISTTLPKIPQTDVDYIKAIYDMVYGVHLNPRRNYVKGSFRQPVRIFYSLHSAFNSTRVKLIPYTINVYSAVNYLKDLEQRGITVILHHMFFEGINDMSEDIACLVSLLSVFNNIELRILRFNKCVGTDFDESKHFDNILNTLQKQHKNIKVQLSPGSEIMAACGQFLLAKTVNI